jgi:pyruvate-formate lyase-activating enzyme
LIDKNQNEEILKVICPLPWVSLSMNTDSSLRVCCNTNHGGFVRHQNKKTFLSSVNKIPEIYSMDTYTELKASMISGKKSDFCNSCYKSEEAGGISIRQYYLSKYSKQIEQILSSKNPESESQIKFIDLSLSNNCNLKCRMCNPGSSYNLKDDFKKINQRFEPDYAERAHKDWSYTGAIQDLIETQSEHLTDMLFTGGEPLINTIHLNILETLVRLGTSKNITITYHSNLMVLSDRILDLWKNFKDIHIHLSLEAHEKFNDYIRFGSRWEKILENLNKLFIYKRKFPMWIEIHSVFQAYNFTIIPEFLEKLKDFSSEMAIFPHFIWIDQPHFLSVNVLPKSIKLAGIEKLEKYLKKNEAFYASSKWNEFNLDKMQILFSYLNRIEEAHNEQHLREFVEYTKKFDDLRNQNLIHFLPEFKNIFNQY